MTVTKKEKSKIVSMLSPSVLERLNLLRKGQTKAFFEVLKWAMLSPISASPVFTLEGYAGTGKTFLVKVLAEALPKVVLTATTNKAVKEIKKSAPGYPAMTIYSLLGLHMAAKEDELVLTPSPGGSNAFTKYRYVFLDEAGMTSKALRPYLERAVFMGTRILMIGDREQIPPVSEELSYIWDLYPTVKLKKVLRHDNQILSLATKVRTRDLDDVDWKSDNESGEGVWCLSYTSFTRKLIKYAEAGHFEKGRAKAVAWRNKTVDELNHIIRFAIFKDKIHESKYLVGDSVVFTSPYSITQYTQVFVDDEGKILNVITGDHPLYGLKCYFLTMQLDIGQHIIKVVHEDAEEEFRSQLNALANKARASRRKEDWYEFWAMRESVASIKYSHALTAHRAQGSTFDFVFVSASDIMRNPNRTECRKCLYTAITRPTTRLFLN